MDIFSKNRYASVPNPPNPSSLSAIEDERKRTRKLIIWFRIGVVVVIALLFTVLAIYFKRQDEVVQQVPTDPTLISHSFMVEVKSSEHEEKRLGVHQRI